jgi:hypothetical protein
MNETEKTFRAEHVADAALDKLRLRRGDAVVVGARDAGDVHGTLVDLVVMSNHWFLVVDVPGKGLLRFSLNYVVHVHSSAA